MVYYGFFLENWIIIIAIFLKLYMCQQSYDPYYYYNQASQGQQQNVTYGIDHFEAEMCRERKHRLDWKKLIEPCANKLNFGTHIYDAYYRTNSTYTRILDLKVRETGEYSRFKIKSYDNMNRPKTFGGDTFRVFINGTSSIQPFVYDLQNGEYETSFLLLDAGSYNVTVFMEGSMCSSYVDPPYDWFSKGDYNGHFQSIWIFKNKYRRWLMNEHIWNMASTFIINVQPGNYIRIQENLKKIRNWQTICHLEMKCNFLQDSFGRWSDEKWKPFVEDLSLPSHQNAKVRKHKGTLWIYGDCYAYHLFEKVWNKTLCTDKFKKCKKTYNWVYPRKHVDAKKDWTVHLQRHFDLDIPWLVNYFKNVLKRSEMNGPENGMLLNLGLHFIRAASFDQYKTLVDKFIDIIKRHKATVIWRTTTSIFKRENKTHKRFQTYQRALMFNAYAMTSMCKAGIPIIDVFPITSAYPVKPDDGIHFSLSLFQPMENILNEFFKYVWT